MREGSPFPLALAQQPWRRRLGDRARRNHGPGGWTSPTAMPKKPTPRRQPKAACRPELAPGELRPPVSGEDEAQPESEGPNSDVVSSLSGDDAREARDNLLGFFRLLLEWHAKAQREQGDKTPEESAEQ